MALACTGAWRTTPESGPTFRSLWFVCGLPPGVNLIGTEDENPEKYFVEERHWLCVSKKGVILREGIKTERWKWKSRSSLLAIQMISGLIYIYIYTPNRPSWINSFTREWIGHFALKWSNKVGCYWNNLQSYIWSIFKDAMTAMLMGTSVHIIFERKWELQNRTRKFDQPKAGIFPLYNRHSHTIKKSRWST